MWLEHSLHHRSLAPSQESCLRGGQVCCSSQRARSSAPTTHSERMDAQQPETEMETPGPEEVGGPERRR